MNLQLTQLIQMSLGAWRVYDAGFWSNQKYPCSKFANMWFIWYLTYGHGFEAFLLSAALSQFEFAFIIKPCGKKSETLRNAQYKVPFVKTHNHRLIATSFS